MTLENSSNSVAAALGYLIPQAEKPYNYMYAPSIGTPQENCQYELRECAIRNARDCKGDMSLDVTGFTLRDAPTDVTDFYDHHQIAAIYIPEIEVLAKELLGAKDAIVFDHLLRKREEGRPAMTFGRCSEDNKPAVVGRVHNDYTEDSGRRRFNLVLPEEKNFRHYVILNFWRPILNPAWDSP